MPFKIQLDPPTLHELTNRDAWCLRVRRIPEELHRHRACISSNGGLCYRKAECLCSINEHTVRESQRAACDIIACGLWVPRKTFSKRTSYGMKHELADWREIWTPKEHDYLSNNEFILAAIALGIPTKADVPESYRTTRDPLDLTKWIKMPALQSAVFALGDAKTRKKRKVPPIDDTDYSYEAQQLRAKGESYLRQYGKNLYDFAPRPLTTCQNQDHAERLALLEAFYDRLSVPAHIRDCINEHLHLIEFYKV